MFTSPERLDSRPIIALRTRGSVLVPEAAAEADRFAQQRSLPDRRYALNNWPDQMPQFYGFVDMDIVDMHKKPRPLEAGVPYIPISHVLEQQPALNLFDVDPARPDLYESLNDKYGPTSNLTIAPDSAQLDLWKLQRAKSHQLINSRGAWNTFKQLEFIRRNQNFDPQLSIYRENMYPPTNRSEREAMIRAKGTFLRDFGGSQ